MILAILGIGAAGCGEMIGKEEKNRHTHKKRDPVESVIRTSKIQPIKRSDSFLFSLLCCSKIARNRMRSGNR